MVRFSIFGIPVRIEPFFWITLVLFGSVGSSNTPDAILRIGLFVLAGFISILVHELGHALTARKFGAYSEITLQAFGGYAAYTGVSLTRPQSFLVTAAGPVVQILLGVAMMLLLWRLPPLSSNAEHFLFMLMGISIFWAVLNLLPIMPLDGGQMLNAILGPKRMKITLWVTIIVSIGVALLMLSTGTGIIFPIFLGLFAWQAIQALKENHWR